MNRLSWSALAVFISGGFGLITANSVIAESKAASPDPTAFLKFIRAQATALRTQDSAPQSAEEWAKRAVQLRENLLKSWGGFPERPCELSPRKMGEISRDGYRVEKLIFQTRQGVWMTANAYVPDAAKQQKVPAILHVHGHWAGAKQDRVVQSRCIGSVKNGFFVLSVDAFGAGERGLTNKLGQYHGEMVGATLFPIGMPLSGLQVYENMRAVDYLQTRPEVDGTRIGITGASGGGNQTMYAGAFDERFRCVVPTCSVGNYQAYLGAACCMCEVVPGALRYTEEGDVLGLAAARGLMVTSATKDAFQFSVSEAQKSFARATDIAKLLGKPDGIRHTIVESPHDYNQTMREAMYGWMTRHLKEQGNGSPIAESPITTEDPESLRCFPGDSRPEDFITIPKFAAAEARQQLIGRKLPANQDSWKTERAERLEALSRVLGNEQQPQKLPLNLRTTPFVDPKNQRLEFDAEPGITLDVRHDLIKSPLKIAVLFDIDHGADHVFASDIATKLRDQGWSIAAPELRTTGRLAIPNDKIGGAPDHNSAEWALWIGRPLLGQWVVDVRRTLDALAEHQGSLPKEITVVGVGSAGTVALCAAALDERISQVISIHSLASYVTDEPYRNQRLGLMVPGIVRDVGDIAHLAALIAPRKVTISGGTTGNGQTVHGDDLLNAYRNARDVFALLGASKQLQVIPDGIFFDQDGTSANKQ